MKKSFVLGIVLGLVLLIFTLKNVDFGKTILLLTKISLWPVLVGLLIVIVGLFLKTWRWQIILANPQIPYSTFFAVLTIGYLINNILPARLGEAARVYLIGRVKKAGLTRTFGSIILEKVFDTLILLIMLFTLLPRFTSNKNLSTIFFGITLPLTWQARFQSFIASFTILKDKRKLASILVISFSIWVFEAFWNYLLMQAFGFSLPLTAAFFLATIVNLGLFIPSPPGYIGVFHFLTTFTLVSLGVEKTTALSYAILQNALEYGLLTGLGLWSTLRLSFDPFQTKWQKI